MLDKFNFYDLLGYLIPGGAVLILLYFVGTPVVTGVVPSLREGDLPDLGSTLGGALLLVAVSYVLGHLVQSVGERWEDHGNEHRGYRISEQMLMLGDDPTISVVVRELIKSKGEQDFGLPPYPTESKLLNRRLHELFELCYRRMVQSDKNGHTDLYLAISALSRGMVVVSWFGMLIGAALLGRELLLLGAAGKSDVPSMGLALAAIASSFIVWRQAEYHYSRFRRYFAASVGFDFLAAGEPAPKKSGWLSGLRRLIT